mmetsp:Transcript_38937/g.39634  ORF Transcript_38937/g.39634 Transcript_38937/m.39634 type:complete len:224 (+) Transcript_38937:75-746(+)
MSYIDYGEGKRPERILLVIAHPDDEAMFFTPFLDTFKNSVVSILCLSNGNADGLGNIRAKELLLSADVFRIERRNVHIINSPFLCDGFDHQWPSGVIADILIEYVEQIDPQWIVTFDESGVSGHPNHIALYRGVLAALPHIRQSTRHTGVRIFSLESCGWVRRFLGPVDVLISLYLNNTLLVVGPSLILASKAMWAHRTQLVWYRLLFIIFSRYSYVNTFRAL